MNRVAFSPFFIETLLVKNGEIQNLKYHNFRLNRTINYFFKENSEIDLKNVINIKRGNSQTQRVRVLYSSSILKVEYFEIKKREFKSLKIVKNNHIEYSFKYKNRDFLNSLKDKNSDEIIIIKNGFVTDTTISNLAFWNGTEWHTPNTPLLNGTKRMELLEKGFLKEVSIKIDDIFNYKKVAMLNAILGFYEIGEINKVIIRKEE